MADIYMNAEPRSRALALLADACLDCLETVDLRSHVAGIAFRTVLNTTEDDALLHACLRSDRGPSGVAMTAHLRWRALHRLAVLGGTSNREIDDEERRDVSAEGAGHAVSCRAALADPVAKERAWNTLFRSKNLPGH